jgi:malate/lactate dehydrogenase
MVQHGGDAAVIIDTPLELTTDGKSLIISPVKDYDRQEKLKQSLDKINKKHGKTLEKLAH